MPSPQEIAGLIKGVINNHEPLGVCCRGVALDSHDAPVHHTRWPGKGRSLRVGARHIRAPEVVLGLDLRGQQLEWEQGGRLYQL